MELATSVQILDEAVCISLCTKTFEMNSSVLPTTPKLNRRNSRATLGLQASLDSQSRRRKSEYKPAVLLFEIDFVSHPDYEGKFHKVIYFKRNRFYKIQLWIFFPALVENIEF